MRICIIGGGAAGLMAASLLSKTNHDVTIVERNEKFGKKLYITGKGRCNFTNFCSNEEFIKNVVSNPKFLYSAIGNFTTQDVIDFFESHGLATKKERGNRMFPTSDKSNDVIKALSKDTHKHKILFNTRAKEILTQNDKVVGVKTEQGTIECDCVFLATGGMSYSSTGSDGDGFRFAKKLGHTVIEPKPSLVPLISSDKVCKSLEGLSLKNVTATIYLNGKKFAEEFGEMLFTAQGVSGPCILTLSALLSRKDLQNCELSIDLKPALDFDTLDGRVKRDFITYANKQFKNALDDLLPKSLIPVIIEKSGINPDKKVNQITVDERRSLVSLMKGFKIKITQFGPFSQAVITSGGVSVKEINPRTMESKHINGLYFIGEVIDVDAFTGGFNLQIAFSTAATAVYAVAEEE